MCFIFSQQSYAACDKLLRSFMQGLAPFGEDIALLTYILEGDSSPRSPSSTVRDYPGEARRPEVSL